MQVYGWKGCTPMRRLLQLFLALLVVVAACHFHGTPVTRLESWKSVKVWVQSSFDERYGQLFTSDLVPNQTNNATAPQVSTQHPKQAASQSRLASCQLSGTISDCACEYGAVEALNQQHLLPTLSRLVKLPFFRYFKVSLYCDCPFFADNGMCMLRDCACEPCEEDEVPRPWRDAENGQQTCGGEGTTEAESAVNRAVEPGLESRLVSIRDWRGFNNPWMPEDDEGTEFSYINLVGNPERYTGYEGRQVWDLIYSQECLRDAYDGGTCTEKRVFYKLISGMHASISAHIAAEYFFKHTGRWGPNLALFQERLGNPGVRERVENLYFAHSFVLRAVLKAGPLLSRVSYDTGMAAEDAATARLVRELVDDAALAEACPVPFDEGRLWKADDGPELKKQLQKQFQNITKAMDCVGCEKCKLWGKLQILGIATSLKILFTDEVDTLVLERNEVIALVNLLQRLSESIETVREISLELINGAAVRHPEGLGAIEDVLDFFQ